MRANLPDFVGSCRGSLISGYAIAMPLDRKALDASVDELEAELCALSRKIHAHPELCFEEHQASAWLGDCLEQKLGSVVERGVGGLPTAFRARLGKGSPRVAILAEYDALPDIGHACGHNLIAGSALGAFLALAKHFSDLSGSIEIIGTPADLFSSPTLTPSAVCVSIVMS